MDQLRAELMLVFASADETLLKNFSAQRVMPLAGPSIAVGRNPGSVECCTYMIVTDTRASRVHVVFGPEGEEGTRWGVRDLGSSNGTYLTPATASRPR